MTELKQQILIFFVWIRETHHVIFNFTGFYFSYLLVRTYNILWNTTTQL